MEEWDEDMAKSDGAGVEGVAFFVEHSNLDSCPVSPQYLYHLCVRLYQTPISVRYQTGQ